MKKPPAITTREPRYARRSGNHKRNKVAYEAPLRKSRRGRR
jgi:hypothetical protein